MTYGEFQQHYESESDNIFAELDRLDEDALLAIIATKPGNIWEGRDNYQIWRALTCKGTAKSIWPLFAIVSDLENPYLLRYHACDALFDIKGIQDDGFKGEVQFGMDAHRQPADQQLAIHKLEQLLRTLPGSPADRPA